MNRSNKFLWLMGVVVVLGLLASMSVAFAQSNGGGTIIPQWVKDRQQYETTFVYVPMTVKAKACQPVIPQWVKDRQQYEPTYVYMPPIPQWVKDRQQYEPTFVYTGC